MPAGDDREWREWWRIAVNFYGGMSSLRPGIADAVAACEVPARARWDALQGGLARTVRIEWGRELSSAESDLSQQVLNQSWAGWIAAAHHLLMLSLQQDVIRELDR